MKRFRFNILKILVVFLFSSSVFSSFWMFRYFNRVSIAQAATVVSLDFGASAIPGDVVKNVIPWALIIPSIVTAIVCLSFYLESRGHKLASFAALCMLFPGMLVFALKVNFDFFEKDTSATPPGGNIFDQYRTPAIPGLSRQKPLNVIWIFVESLEKTYIDSAIDSELDRATGFMTPVTVSPLINRFTAGGVMSAHCGAPIYFTHPLAVHFHHAEFDHATCFDDVLRGYGYASYFVVGHDASLSGFRSYYEKHASAAIYDAKFLESIKTPKESEFTTYPDEKVFETALGVLKSPALKKPFALNILTLDNHAPSGFPSNACKSQFGTSMANVIRCDNHALAGFIQELNRSGVMQDTVLVVMGDHPFMGTFDNLSLDRDIFARIYTPIPGKKIVNMNPTPFDFFPSVLSAMGFDVQQRQYGFGYSFYDVEAYPAKDWKSWLETFGSAKPTESYKSLSR